METTNFLNLAGIPVKTKGNRPGAPREGVFITTKLQTFFKKFENYKKNVSATARETTKLQTFFFSGG